ncbi:hypothetical protein Vretimale_5890, partial [Volvox reticuliferus]
AVARSLLVAQFVAAGQPLVAASTLARPAMAQLVAALAAVRRGYRALLCPPSLTSADRVLTWHSPYAGGGEPDWAAANPDYAANALVLTIGGGASRPGHLLAAAFNPNAEPVAVALPRPPSGTVWRLLVDTARSVPTVQAAGGSNLGAVLPATEHGSYTMGPNSALLLDAVPQTPASVNAPAASAAAAGGPAVPVLPRPPGPAIQPPPGYGMSPAAAAAAARPPPQTYKTRRGGS